MCWEPDPRQRSPVFKLLCFFGYRTGVSAIKNNAKNLYLSSFKTDLDFWDCLERENSIS